MSHTPKRLLRQVKGNQSAACNATYKFDTRVVTNKDGTTTQFGASAHLCKRHKHHNGRQGVVRVETREGGTRPIPGFALATPHESDGGSAGDPPHRWT